MCSSGVQTRGPNEGLASAKHFAEILRPIAPEQLLDLLARMTALCKTMRDVTEALGRVELLDPWRPADAVHRFEVGQTGQVPALPRVHRFDAANRVVGRERH